MALDRDHLLHSHRLVPFRIRQAQLRCVEVQRRWEHHQKVLA